MAGVPENKTDAFRDGGVADQLIAVVKKATAEEVSPLNILMATCGCAIATGAAIGMSVTEVCQLIMVMEPPKP